jgi:hypothetical protein
VDVCTELLVKKMMQLVKERRESMDTATERAIRKAINMIKQGIPVDLVTETQLLNAGVFLSELEEEVANGCS